MQYNVLTNVKHNGSLYVPGALIDLDEDVAAPLIKDGVVEELRERPKPQSAKPTTQTQPQGKKPDETDQKTDGSGNPENTGGDDNQALEDLPYHELQNRAEALGLKFVGVSRGDLIASIQEAEAKTDEEDDGNGDDADDL